MSAVNEAIPAPRSWSRSGAVALVLGLLGLPGVTIAWDLPHGGFWIGLPLAVAAIVVAVRALDSSRRLALAAIALGSIEILFTATWLLLALLG